MNRLYWKDTYLMEHKAKITVIDQDEYGNYLRLDETIFHPQGGGQPSDEGTINGVQVIKLRDLRDINEVNHYLQDISAFKIGDMVELAIDRAKRLEYAALHTAGHITGGILRTVYHYTEQTAANHFPKQAKVEFKFASDITKEQFEKEVNLVIAETKPISEHYDENGMRCIQIEGLWTELCSGTHVHDTGEVADFSIRKIKKEKDRLVLGYHAEHKLRKND